MALIDKAALVSEIDKRLNYRIESLKAINNGTFWKEELEDEFNKPLTRCTFNAVKNELFELKCFLDTLEVKEVDLMIHTIIAECCNWLAVHTELNHEQIEDCRNLMLTVKDEQLKAKQG